MASPVSRLHLIAELYRRLADPTEATFNCINNEFIALKGIEVRGGEVIQVALDRADVVENVLQPAVLPIRKQRRGPAGWPSALAAT